MLYDTIQPDQITIPQFILTNDKKVRNRFTHHLYQNPVLVSVWLYIPCAAHVNVHTVGLAMAYVFVNTSIFYIFHFLSPLPHSWMAQIITDLCTSQLLARKRDFKWELLLRHSSYYTCMTDYVGLHRFSLHNIVLFFLCCRDNLSWVSLVLNYSGNILFGFNWMFKAIIEFLLDITP